MTETLISLIDEACDRFGDQPCLIDGQERLSFHEVRNASVRVANGLNATGFTPGMRGAVFSPNNIWSVVATLGIIRAGGIWVPINPRNSLADNLTLLKAFGCDAVFYHSVYDEAADRIADQHPDVKLALCLDGVFAEWISRQSAASVAHQAKPTDIVMIPMTGGTTGLPKAVALSNRNWVALLKGTAAESDTGPLVNLAAAPMTHVGGRIALTVIYRGGTTVILDQVDPARIVAAIETYGVTDLFLPPTAIYALLDYPGLETANLSSLRSVAYGSAPISVAQLRRALIRLGPVMVGGFGQTEAPLLIARLRAEDHFIDGQIAPDARLRSVGRATKSSQLGIMDDDGHLLPRGEAGEIVVKGDFVCEGYFENPEATAQIRRNGWHLTGDIGIIDDLGFLTIIDRKKDMIITGGFNVYSSEVEAVISALPGVRECVVIGAPDEKWGEVVTAVVSLDADAEIDAITIQQECKTRLGSVKAPKQVDFVQDFPRNANSKILKKAVRDTYWAGAERLV